MPYTTRSGVTQSPRSPARGCRRNSQMRSIHLRRGIEAAAILLASAAALLAQLPVPDGPVNPGQLVSYTLEYSTGRGTNFVTSQIPAASAQSPMTVPKGQPLPLPTFTCHYSDATSGDVTETIQFIRFTIDGDDPTPAATADHFSALTFATPLDRTITLEANFTQTAAKPPPGRAAKFTVYHQDIYAPLNLVPGGPPTDEGPVTTNSGGTVAVRFTNRRQI